MNVIVLNVICSNDVLCFSQVDKDFIPGLMYIRDNEATAEEFEAMTLPFTVPNASGQDIQLSSKYSHITLENRAEYVRLAINYRWERSQMNKKYCAFKRLFVLHSCVLLFFIFFVRLHEFDEQVSAVREGMARVVPVPLLSLFTGYELETMVNESSARLWNSVLQLCAGLILKCFVCSGVWKPRHPTAPAQVSGHLQRS